MSVYDKEPSWSTADKAVMALIAGLHAFAIWYFVQQPTPEPETIPTVLEVSMIIPPPDEPPPPPEPPKPPPPPPPKVIPKTPPPKPVEQPKVITEIPVQAPVPPPPPAPPAPPPPPAPPVAAISAKLNVREIPPKPVYPRKAQRDGIEGTVSILFMVDEQGIPTEVKVVKSSNNFDLDNAARASAMKYRFVPRIINGVAVKAQGTLDIVFKLSEQ